MFCTRLANGGLFPTGDPIVPFVISPRFECLNKRTHTHKESSPSLLTAQSLTDSYPSPPLLLLLQTNELTLIHNTTLRLQPSLTHSLYGIVIDSQIYIEEPAYFLASLRLVIHVNVCMHTEENKTTNQDVCAVSSPYIIIKLHPYCLFP